jgi:hypothetical protein
MDFASIQAVHRLHENPHYQRIGGAIPASIDEISIKTSATIPPGVGRVREGPHLDRRQLPEALHAHGVHLGPRHVRRDHEHRDAAHPTVPLARPGKMQSESDACYSSGWTPRRGVGVLLRSPIMRTRWLAIAALLAFASAARAGEPIDLKVLYAGNPGSDREADFKAFLAEHFTRAGTIDYRRFRESDAKGYDVVIFDWTSIYSRDARGKVKEGPEMRIISPPPPKIAETYARPTIMIGAMAGGATRPLKLKIDWL